MYNKQLCVFKPFFYCANEQRQGSMLWPLFLASCDSLEVMITFSHQTKMFGLKIANFFCIFIGPSKVVELWVIALGYLYIPT
jgi:hypothetical protein